MAGFIRRFDYNPGNDVITQIEGLTIIDNPQPGAIQGASTGFACVIGEYADMTYAIQADGAGLITSHLRPVRIFSQADFLMKAGLLDLTLGDFGKYCGNGWVETANRTFTQLAILPVNLCSGQGIRLFRVLPPCQSVTQSLPFVPVVGAVVQAGTPFNASSGVIKTGQRAVFTNLDPIARGVGGSTTTAVSAATQDFVADTGFVWANIVRPDGTLGARKGDVLVIGNTTGSALAADTGTYRVNATPVVGDGATIELQSMNGANFAWTGNAAMPWRLHFSSDADTAPVVVRGSTTPGGYDANDAGGFVLGARPLTDSTGSASGSTAYPVSTPMTPVVAPTSLSATFWDPLSGLAGLTHPVVALTFTAATQAANVTNSSTVDALYTAAINVMVSEQDPAREIDILWCARKSATIRSALYQHAIIVNQRGISRLVLVSPPLDTVTVDQVAANTYPGVPVSRSERQVYCWPGVRMQVNGASGTLVKRADGTTTSDGVIDIGFDGWVAALLSVLRPELDAGQAGPPVPQAFAGILGYQTGLPVELGIDSYIFLKQLGVCDFRMDRNAGPIIQSAITTSLVSGQTRINRRRMADYIEDSLANRLVMFVKNIATQENRDAAASEAVAFLEELKNPTNPSNQRISDYLVNTTEGNTPELEAQGIWALNVYVRMLPIDRYIVLNVTVGENVTIATTL